MKEFLDLEAFGIGAQRLLPRQLTYYKIREQELRLVIFHVRPVVATYQAQVMPMVRDRRIRQRYLTGGITQFKDIAKLNEAMAIHHYNTKRIYLSLKTRPAAYAASLASRDMMFAKGAA